MGSKEREIASENKERFLEGKVALVTGASRGIGAEIARALGSRGATVVVTYREKAKRAEEVALEINQISKGKDTAYLVRADITEEEGIKAILAQAERLNGLDILVLSAAGGLEPWIEEDKRWQWAREINVKSQLDLTRRLLSSLKPGGLIIYITSHWAHRYGEEGFEVPSWYAVVAKTKHECEQELKKLKGDLEEKKLRLFILSGALTKETGVYKLWQWQARRDPELAARLEEEAIEISRWGQVLTGILGSSFESGEVVLVDK